MATGKISNKRVRDIQRTVHLMCGLLVAAYIYTPLPDVPVVGVLVQLVAIPALVATGMAMWQAARFRRLLTRGRPAATPRARSA